MKIFIVGLAIFFMAGTQALAGGYYGHHGRHGRHGGWHRGSYTGFAIGVGIGALAAYACSPRYGGSCYPGYWGRCYGPPVLCAPAVVYAPQPVYAAAPAVVERPVVVGKTVVINKYSYGSGNDHWKPQFSAPSR